MIALDGTSSMLGRFVRDLDAQAPASLRGLRADLGAFSGDDVEAARIAWASRIIDEYRSVVVFTELLSLLAKIEAPFEAICTVQRLIGDELRHTRLCAEVAGWLGGLDDLEIDLADLGLPPSDETPEGRAFEIVVRELVVAEGESVAVLAAYRDATTDPAVRAAMGILLRDEARHAAAGRHLSALLERALPPRSTAALRARLPAVVELDREWIRAAHREGATGGPGRGLGASLRADELP